MMASTGRDGVMGYECGTSGSFSAAALSAPLSITKLSNVEPNFGRNCWFTWIR
jgi:hypothetical protein